MNVNELTAKIKELRELQALIEEATAEAEAIKDSIKAVMGEAEELRAGEYKITWKAVTSSRFDKAAMIETFGKSCYDSFCKPVTIRRFVVA